MKKVYLCMSTDIIQTGHINVIEKAAELGEVTVGVLCDECVAMYEKYPILPLEERMKIINNIKGVSHVVVQDDIYYDKILKELKPDIVVHGDNWKKGYQKDVRERVIRMIAEWGGELVEIPYYKSPNLNLFEHAMMECRGVPEVRRQILRRQIASGEIVKIMVAYDGLSALLVEKTSVEKDGEKRQFDGIWVSSLCDSTAKGKPDIELVDLTSRISSLNDMMEVTTKPIIFDADTGGLIEHFVYNIKTLERIGVSAVIIEDKIGLKRNSLFGNDVEQHQDSIEHFCTKIREGKKALTSSTFMLIARIESLILEQGVEDALERARAYVEAGADGIMIHSRAETPDEIFAFVDAFRAEDKDTAIVVVPTTFNKVREDEFKEHGVNIVIYANHMLRAAFPAMKKAVTSVLENERCYEASQDCMSIKEILTLVPME